MPRKPAFAYEEDATGHHPSKLHQGNNLPERCSWPLRSTGKLVRMSLFVEFDGGSAHAALRMVNLRRQYVDQLTMLRP